MKYYCCDQRRLEVVKLHGTLNGLEYLEVDDSGVVGDPTRQLTLFVKFLRPVPILSTDNLRIWGGERIKTVEIEWIAIADALPAGEPSDLVDGLVPLNEFLVIRTRFYGDFSYYTLSLVSGPGSDTPPAGFDPRLSEIPFSFKVQCESDFDCATATLCPAPPVDNPRLDYLAKDYTRFRRLMLDRLSVLMPEWRGRNPADSGVTLIELLAYVGDQLSYQQDAVATEAYLGTARQRTSLRRHARLVDYAVHEGCNARVWVRVFVNDEGMTLPGHTPLLTHVPNTPDRLAPGSDQLRDVLASGTVVFETVEDTVLYQTHERMTFYSWGQRECCLPKGTTQATLSGHFPNLKAGDVLVFAEELGPRTGFAEDADRGHRWAVRLTDVRLDQDPFGGLFLPVPNNGPLDITEIRWAEQDALPFPLCLSTITDQDHGAVYLDAVSAAYGNIVLADHGRTLHDEALGKVPAAHLTLASTQDQLSCARPPLKAVPPRFRPRLAERPLTHTLPLIALTAERLFSFTATAAIIAALQARTFTPALEDALEVQGVVFEAGPVAVQGGDGLWSVADGVNAYRLQLESGQIQVSPLAAAAARITVADPRRARPAISLASQYQSIPDTWQPRADLLASDASATEFVVESEHDGSAYLRFGDDVHGKRPDSDTVFTATYRIGNGTAGNIGLESIAHIVSNDGRLLSVSNPLPAQGGVEPENAEEIRRDAPEAFRIQERAVTPEDYAEVAERHPSVQRAAATFRWTGSWYTVFLTVDRKGGGEVDAAYEQRIRDHIERYRMAGYDLEIDGPRYVPLELGMTVCVKPDYFRVDVRAALMRVFSRGWLIDGARAVFHPDHFTFGQPVYLSMLYEAAQAVQGVASVVITTFRRLRVPPDPKPLDDGVLTIGRLEIARLDNDPNFPERGVLKLSIGGGK
ncbi:MAG: putative baseplate assembly protein [Nitrosomonas sp.]|nr:putative baseplate assembly protein [Nitrosomonas sp.]